MLSQHCCAITFANVCTPEEHLDASVVSSAQHGAQGSVKLQRTALKDVGFAVRAEGCRVAERMAEVVSPRRADTHPLANGGSLTEEESSAFECNICYEIAQSPVVTLCGHLYCWPCLYRCVRGAAVPCLCVSCACRHSAALVRFCLC